MKHIFIDTNIFLHFQDFEKIDWQFESSSNNCKLIVAPIVVDELDQKKIGNSKISKRARKVLNRFEVIAENANASLNDNVLIEILLEKPSSSIYEKYDLNFNENDHRLLASILSYKEKNNIENIVLCSNDIGPRLRAKQFEIGNLKLNEKYLLPSQESDSDKKLRKLENENRVLKSKIPDVSLKFEDSAEYLELEKKPFVFDNLDEFYTQKMNEIKSDFSYLIPKAQDSETNGVFASLNNLHSLTNTQIEEYNSELDSFYLNCDNYIKELFKYKRKESLTYEITFCLVNSGTIPAENVDIHIHFPDGFELFESIELRLEEIPEMPEPPYKPKGRFDLGISSSLYIPNISTPTPNVELSNLNRPTIRKTNSYNVDFNRESLKHGYVFKLDRLSIIFPSFEEIKNFQVDYAISAANIPSAVTGKLNLKFN